MAKIKNPCETCTQKELAKWGACNHGLGICEECMKYCERKFLKTEEAEHESKKKL